MEKDEIYIYRMIFEELWILELGNSGKGFLVMVLLFFFVI